MLDKLFKIYRSDGHIIFNLLYIKFKFKNFLINQLADCCCIPDLNKLEKFNTKFPHPVGIVIAKDAIIGHNCVIYQNVTIGKKNGLIKQCAPKIGDNVKIYANAVVIGNISIGNNVIIGANSVVNFDIADNLIVAGNPAKIIGRNE
mgnify:CR=1 FL=1